MRQRTGRADPLDVHFGDVDTWRHARRWPRSQRKQTWNQERGVGRRFGKKISADWASVNTPASGTLYKRGCHLSFANLRVTYRVRCSKEFESRLRAWCSTLPAVTPPTSHPKGFWHSAKRSIVNYAANSSCTAVSATMIINDISRCNRHRAGIISKFLCANSPLKKPSK